MLGAKTTFIAGIGAGLEKADALKKPRNGAFLLQGGAKAALVTAGS